MDLTLIHLTVDGRNCVYGAMVYLHLEYYILAWHGIHLFKNRDFRRDTRWPHQALEFVVAG